MGSLKLCACLDTQYLPCPVAAKVVAEKVSNMGQNRPRRGKLFITGVCHRAFPMQGCIQKFCHGGGANLGYEKKRGWKLMSLN